MRFRANVGQELQICCKQAGLAHHKSKLLILFASVLREAKSPGFRMVGTRCSLELFVNLWIVLTLSVTKCLVDYN